LFKESWIPIHKYITETFDLHEPPTAYFRKGDESTHLESFQEQGCVIKEHPFGYRSIHFIVKSKPEKIEHLAEIQVRTIFEEAWSEIDHQIRYPYELDNQILNQFLLIFNRLSGSADEMGSFIKNLQLQLKRREVEILKQKETIDELNKKVEQQNISQEEWTKMRDQIKSIKIQPLLANIHPLQSLSELIKNDSQGIGLMSSIYPIQKKFILKSSEKKIEIDEKKNLGKSSD
jgi:putative GTP pyrophosphokinase